MSSIFNTNPKQCFTKKGFGFAQFGTPEGTRTPDLLIRSQSLYPTELPAHMHFQVPRYNSISSSKMQVLFSKFFNFFSQPVFPALTGRSPLL